ncbi:MATE family efflux transporter [Paenibacillus alkalitolerans]|uniref:MATE family efflux transporter n=1 Tax=Paenibacillus alkalitolerans TaxID=2799335 RepID=UPI001F3DABA5|nr:MATE family efflux transporter [Paenibacillus alkalitolerans]
MRLQMSLLQKQSPLYTHKSYLLLSLPLVLSALSTPLLGAVDTAIVGQLGDPVYIGSVAVGSLIFNYLYWLLGFLRVSTSGFTAQADGAGDSNGLVMAFSRPFFLGLGFGFVFIAFQDPILRAALYFIGPSQSVAALVEQYYSIRIWGAPLLLANYAVYGWLIGRSKVKMALWMQLLLNGLNIGLNFFFVLGLGMKVQGVAWATLISEAFVFLAGALFVWSKVNRLSKDWRTFFHAESFVHMLKVNRDLFIRTFCLLSVFGLFTAAGAGRGDAVLAANAILMQIALIVSYIFDGFANAGSIWSGRAYGEKNGALLRHTIKLGMFWSFVSALVLSVGLAGVGGHLISLFTASEEVQALAVRYSVWLFVFPIVVFGGLLLNGIFNGATESVPIRNSMIISMIVFVAVLYGTRDWIGNDGLWLAFIVFSLVRSLMLWMYVSRLKRKLD